MKMIRRFPFFFLSVISLFFSILASAQDDDNVLIYSSSEDSRQGNRSTNASTTLIKINPLLILNGDIPMYWERKIGKKTSIEIGVGATHWDLLFENFNRVNSNDNGETSETRRAQIGYSGRINLKYWPSSYYPPLEDWYGGFEFRFRNYKTEIVDCSATGTSGFLPEKRLEYEGKIIFGYIYYLSDNIMVDIYSGIGLRFRTLERLNCVDDGTGFTSVFNDPDNGSDSSPVIALGVKIGFAL